MRDLVRDFGVVVNPNENQLRILQGGREQQQQQAPLPPQPVVSPRLATTSRQQQTRIHAFVSQIGTEVVVVSRKSFG